MGVEGGGWVEGYGVAEGGRLGLRGEDGDWRLKVGARSGRREAQGTHKGHGTAQAQHADSVVVVEQS